MSPMGPLNVGGYKCVEMNEIDTFVHRHGLSYQNDYGKDID